MWLRMGILGGFYVASNGYFEGFLCGFEWVFWGVFMWLRMGILRGFYVASNGYFGGFLCGFEWVF